MDSIRKDVEAVIKEEDEEEYDQGKDAKLYGGADLRSGQQRLHSTFPWVTDNPARHLSQYVESRKLDSGPIFTLTLASPH